MSNDLNMKQRDEILKKYGFYFQEERCGDRGVWRHPSQEFLHLITKSQGSSCNFIELFNYDENDPKDDFYHIWDNNSIFISFDNKNELSFILNIITKTC